MDERTPDLEQMDERAALEFLTERTPSSVPKRRI
jgi:hypothetical protein